MATKLIRRPLTSADGKQHVDFLLDGVVVGTVFETYHPTIRYEASTPYPHVASKRVATIDEGEQWIVEQLSTSKALGQ